mmetsp:Transcript_27596/g.49784  ORF Transcript_27596/g.49784 Transcript_27596/m.49784 type:complete len:88 (-) Transcript_27596:502-765(-)
MLENRKGSSLMLGACRRTSIILFTRGASQLPGILLGHYIGLMDLVLGYSDNLEVTKSARLSLATPVIGLIIENFGLLFEYTGCWKAG